MPLSRGLATAATLALETLALATTPPPSHLAGCGTLGEEGAEEEEADGDEVEEDAPPPPPPPPPP